MSAPNKTGRASSGNVAATTASSRSTSATPTIQIWDAAQTEGIKQDDKTEVAGDEHAKTDTTAAGEGGITEEKNQQQSSNNLSSTAANGQPQSTFNTATSAATKQSSSAKMSAKDILRAVAARTSLAEEASDARARQSLLAKKERLVKAIEEVQAKLDRDPSSITQQDAAMLHSREQSLHGRTVKGGATATVQHLAAANEAEHKSDEIKSMSDGTKNVHEEAKNMFKKSSPDIRETKDTHNVPEAAENVPPNQAKTVTNQAKTSPKESKTCPEESKTLPHEASPSTNKAETLPKQTRAASNEKKVGQNEKISDKGPKHVTASELKRLVDELKSKTDWIASYVNAETMRSKSEEQQKANREKYFEMLIKDMQDHVKSGRVDLVTREEAGFIKFLMFRAFEEGVNVGADLYQQIMAKHGSPDSSAESSREGSAELSEDGTPATPAAHQLSKAGQRQFDHITAKLHEQVKHLPVELSARPRNVNRMLYEKGFRQGRAAVVREIEAAARGAETGGRVQQKDAGSVAGTSKANV